MKIYLIILLTACDGVFGIPVVADPPDAGSINIHDANIDAYPCEGLILDDGSCYFQLFEGYIWGHDEAELQCETKKATLCDLAHVHWAFEIGATSCADGWTSTPCAGSYMTAYPESGPTTSGCTHGTNETCSPVAAGEGANCCRLP